MYLGHRLFHLARIRRGRRESARRVLRVGKEGE